MFTATSHTLSESQFDQLVAGLYDAATGGRSWVSALTPVQAVFGARAALLHTIDIADGRMLSLDVAGPAMDQIGFDYVSQWEPLDPRKQRVLQLGPAAAGQWLHCQDYLGDEFRQRNRFFRHFMAAAEARHSSIHLIAQDAHTITGFVLELHASRGPLDADERHLAARLGRHVEAALRGHQRYRQLAATHLVGHQLLEAFAYPMWLIGTDRQVQFANAPALALEQQAQRVQRPHGRLRLGDGADDRQLGVLLHTLQGQPHLSRHPLRLKPGPDGAPAWLHLAVLEPQAVMGQAFGAGRCVVATLFSPDQVRALDPFALARMFGLTPTEARVAALLGEGLEPGAIAERLNVRLSTIRTHVRQVLAAMGQSRMTDVVRVLRQGEALWAVPAAPADAPPHDAG